MADLSQIELNSTTYDLKDSAARSRGVEYIRGTWTAASGTWTGVSTDTELYDGKQIILYMPFAGSGNATLNLSLAGGGTTGAKNVYFESTTRFTTQKGQNSQLHMIYHQAQTLSDGNTYEGWWYIANSNSTFTAATETPLMDGTAAVGSSAKYAREDHVHPTDTSRASASDVSAKILKTSSSFAIPSSSVTKTMSGITANHVLIRWNFSSSAENNPPCDLTWTTASGSFTITKNAGSTSESIQPVFALPTSVSAT